MTATNHVITGMLVATFVHNPAVALPLAFASHFALDAIPHFDATSKEDMFNRRYYLALLTDMALAASVLGAVLVLQPAHVWLLLASGVLAASPDLMWLYYLVFDRGGHHDKWPWLVRFHRNIQTKTGPRFWPVELSWLVVTVVLLASRLANR